MAGGTRNKTTTDILYGSHRRSGKFKGIGRRHDGRADRVCQFGAGKILIVGQMALPADEIVDIRGTQKLRARDHIGVRVMTDRAGHQTCGDTSAAGIEGCRGILGTGCELISRRSPPEMGSL